MTCAECLSTLATASLREMTTDSPVMIHSATCPECARVTNMVREREYEAATVLNNLPPMSNPITVAESAVLTAKRRRVGRIVVMLSGAALVVTLWITAATVVFPALTRKDVGVNMARRTETIPLSCLSPQQAADIINPYVRERGSTYYLPTSGISAITVRGTPQELSKSRDLIQHFERDPSAACNAPAATLRRLQEELSRLQGKGNATPTVAPDAAPATPKKK